MNKLKGRIPDCQLDGTDSIIFSGDLPECITSTDCSVNTSSLTYLITLLLERYCEQENIIDADMSSVDLTCLLAANPDIVLPDNITVETLSTFFKDHICALYGQISDLTTIVDNQLSLICSNDIVQLDQDSNLIIDVLFNDYTSQVPGSIVLTITTSPINGTAVINGDKTITYTPNPDFFGNDSLIYKVVKGTRECSAKVSIKVNKVITEDDLNTSIINNLITILESNEYWDIGLPKGTKLIISNENLADFDFTVITPGLGKTGTKWAKWAICNGFNGTEDFRKNTFRGFDHTDSDYNLSGLTGGLDSVTLTRANIPPHRHGYTFFTQEYMEESNWASYQNSTLGSGYQATVGNDSGDGDTRLDNGDDSVNRRYYTNTGNGTSNYGGRDEIANGGSTPTAFSIRNEYTTTVTVQKIV